jgi:biotin operon repressor
MNYKKNVLRGKKLSNVVFSEAFKNNVSLTQLACKIGISRATLVKHLIELNKKGLIPSNNLLLNRIANQSSKLDRPRINSRLLARREKIIGFINDCRLKKKPVSVNLLQKKFGGEKAFIGAILAEQEKKFSNSNKIIIRRDKSDQPKRK